jgi:hypothetical protein
MSLERFIKLWTHPDYAPEPVIEEELRAAEQRLQTRLPTVYRNAVMEFGLPRPTIELLDAICDRELDLYGLGDFLGPTEIVEVTGDWRDLGLPEELVAFATDGMSNLFCFPTSSEVTEELPVFLWDHDSKEVESVARSCSAGIDGYCLLSPN